MRDDAPHPVTPDGRYFVVRGRLWRCSDPSLPADVRSTLVHALMDARRALSKPLSPAEVTEARRRVHDAKTALGEQGAVWWTDGAPDLNRRMVANTSYAAWHDALQYGE